MRDFRQAAHASVLHAASCAVLTSCKVTAWPLSAPQEHATAAEHRTGSKVRCQRKRKRSPTPAVAPKSSSALAGGNPQAYRAARPQTPSERVKKEATTTTKTHQSQKMPRPAYTPLDVEQQEETRRCRSRMSSDERSRRGARDEADDLLTLAPRQRPARGLLLLVFSEFAPNYCSDSGIRVL